MMVTSSALARFDLVDALHDYAKTLTLHGDDVLAHNNWEIGENWLRQYQYVICSYTAM